MTGVQTCALPIFSNIPGPMVSAVQLAKGAGSATLGFDGLTGGLNYQLKAGMKDPNSLSICIPTNKQGVK